jgi:tetratricopeptide (TPR) repeat protein
LNQKLPAGKNRINLFHFAIVLTFLLFFGIPQFTWAQSPQHLQSFNISPLKEGEFFLLSKKPGEALKVFKNLWKQEPQNSYAVRGIVRSYHALGTLQEAVSLLSRYLEKHSQSSSAAYGLGFAFYLQGKFEESRRVLNTALSLDRKNALALNNLSAVLVELQEYAGALRRVKEAISIAPNEWMFYRNLQMIYASSGKPDQFEKEYRQLLAEKFPAKAKGYGLILAQQLRQKSFKLYVDGKIDECINTIVAMLDLYREINHAPGIVAGLFSLAVLYEEQGKDKLALEKYREVLKINPQHIQAHEKMQSLSPKKE